MFELSPQDWTAIALSLRVAVVSTLIALPFGIAIATVLARASFWGKSALDALVHLPLVLPPVVTGYLLLVTFGRKAPVGAFLADHFGIVFSFRWTGAALACGVCEPAPKLITGPNTRSCATPTAKALARSRGT